MSNDGGPSAKRERAKRVLMWAAAARTVLALVALLLVPLLYRHYFLVLVLLRPSQGVLLAGAVLARHGDVSLPAMLVAAIPLQVVIVWVYLLLGQAWQREIDSDEKLPFITARVLERNWVRRLRRVMRVRGVRLVVLGRFAIFPTGLLAATAGASGMEAKRFFPADGLALIVATGLVVAAGYALGISRDRAGPWVVVAGVAGLAALAGALTFHLWRGTGDDSGSGPEEPHTQDQP